MYTELNQLCEKCGEPLQLQQRAMAGYYVMCPRCKWTTACEKDEELAIRAWEQGRIFERSAGRFLTPQKSEKKNIKG